MIKKDDKLDDLIRAAIKTKDVPSPQLNNDLKIKLYHKEAKIRQGTLIKDIPIWYVPMVLNVVIFSLLAVLAFIMISNQYLAIFTVGICVYFGITGVVITLVGLKRTKIKDELTLHVKKRGALYEQ